MLRQANLARQKLRRVKPSMAALLDSLSAEQFDRVLNYVSYLPVPAADLAPDAQWRNPDFQQGGQLQ